MAVEEFDDKDTGNLPFIRRLASNGRSYTLSERHELTVWRGASRSYYGYYGFASINWLTCLGWKYCVRIAPKRPSDVAVSVSLIMCGINSCIAPLFRIQLDLAEILAPGSWTYIRAAPWEVYRLLVSSTQDLLGRRVPTSQSSRERSPAQPSQDTLETEHLRIFTPESPWSTRILWKERSWPQLVQLAT